MGGTSIGAGRPVGRRRALKVLAAAGVATLLRPLRVAGMSLAVGVDHPDPRPGIDASNVLSADAVAPHAAELFDQVRQIPQVVDGIACQCGCGELPGMVSLLSCYEGVGMAQYCDICSGEGRLAYELHREGRTLDEIRAAVDRRFG